MEKQLDEETSRMKAISTAQELENTYRKKGALDEVWYWMGFRHGLTAAKWLQLEE